MKKYIALLRGINVGGKNKVPMPLLKSAFEEAGFSQVSTYINSGNVLFSASNEDVTTLQQKCRKIIADTFGLDIPVAIIASDDYSEALSHAPEWWGNDSDSKHNAIFVIAPASAHDVMQEIELNLEYEKVFGHGQVIYWSAPLKTFSRTKLSRVVGTKTYDKITIRNANTTKKLLALLNQ